MAATLTLTVGALTVPVTANATDTQVRDMVLKFYDCIETNPPVGITNAGKAEVVLRWFIRHMRARALAKYRAEKEAQLDTEAAVLYAFE